MCVCIFTQNHTNTTFLQLAKKKTQKVTSVSFVHAIMAQNIVQKVSSENFLDWYCFLASRTLWRPYHKTKNPKPNKWKSRNHDL